MTNSANQEAELNRTTTSSERQVPPVTPYLYQNPLLGRILIPLGILLGISGLLAGYLGGEFLLDLLNQDPESIGQMLPEYLKEKLYLLSEIPYIAEAMTAMTLPLLLLVFMPGAILLFAGHAIARLGRRHAARAYEANNLHAIEAPILYLRPFVADGYLAELNASIMRFIFHLWFDKRDRTLWRLQIVDGMMRYEELLAYAFQRVGTLVAIGDPKEDLPLLGATRFYTGKPGLAESVDDETWRKVVERQIQNAQLILLHIGLSDGLRWEVNRVVQLADPQRVVLCLNRERTRGLPFKMIFRGIRGGEIQAIQEMWSQFRNSFAAIFPHGLPEVVGDARFVKFDSDWTPIPLETAKRKLVWFLPGPTPDLSRKTIHSAFAWLTWILVPEQLGRPVVRYIVNVVSFAVGFWVVLLLALDVLLMGAHLVGAIVDVSSAKNPHTVAAQEWFQRGVTADDPDEKIRSYTEALRLSPGFANAYYNRGVAKYMKDDLDGEISDYTEALRLQPDFVNAYYYRGNARSKKDDLDGAITDYTEVLRLKPDNAKAYYNRGVARGDKGDLDGEIKDYTEALRLQPGYADVYYHRGNARSKKDDLDGAITDYTEVLQLKPDEAEAYIARGTAIKAKGDMKAAQRDFDKAQLLTSQPDK